MRAVFSTILICVFVSFGGFLFGYDTGMISGVLAMGAFKRDFGHNTGGSTDTYTIDAPIQSLIVSILSVGTFIGALVAGVAGDWLGRKWAIIFSCVVFSVGIALQTAAAALGLMVAGRFIAGLGVGLLSDLVPLYQAEAAPKHLRGALVSCYQLAITLGILVSFLVELGTEARSDRAAYRIPIGIQFIWAGILGFGMLLLPDSPRGLLRSGKREKAAKALAHLRGIKDPEDVRVRDELKEIQANLDYEAELGGVSYMDLFRGTIARRTWLGILLQMFQQLTGVNFIFYYGTVFFQMAGIPQSYIVQSVTGVVNVVSTIPALIWIDRWGRRRLLLFGAAVMFIGQLVTGIMGTVFPAQINENGDVISHNSAAGIVMIVFICIFIFGFACSWGPGAWVVPSEIFPLRVRAKGISLATASNWFWNWVLAFVTPYLVNRGPGNANLGPKIAFIWTAFILLAMIYTWFTVPETKGLSLEDVDEMFNSGVKPWKSRAFVPSGRGREDGVDGGQRVLQKKDVEDLEADVGGRGVPGNVVPEGGRIPPAAA